MKLILLSCITTVVLCTVEQSPENWIDYDDMRHYNIHKKSMETSSYAFNDNEAEAMLHVSTQNTSEESAEKVQLQVRRLEIFIESLINRLLYNTDLKNVVIQPETKFETVLSIKITSEELEKLKQFGSNFKSSNLTDFDRILSLIMKSDRGFSFHILKPFLNPFEELFYHMSLEKIVILVGLVSFCVMTWMFAVGNSIKRIMIFAYLLCFMGGLASNAWKMYTEAVAEQFAESQKRMHIPDVCNPTKMSWFSFFFSSKDDCREYHKSMLVHPMSKVSLSVVFSETISMMLIHPLKALGLSVGDFLYGVSKSAPWPFNFMFLPIVFIVSSMIFLFVVAVYMGATLKFWTLLGGVHIQSDSRRRDDYEKILNAVELKHMIENNNQSVIITEVATVKQFLASETKRLTSKAEGGNHSFTFSNFYSRSHSIASCSSGEGNNLINPPGPGLDNDSSVSNLLAQFRFVPKRKLSFRNLNQRSIVVRKMSK